MIRVEQPSGTPCQRAQNGDDSLEIAMTGISGSVCDLYSGNAYDRLSGLKLAQNMTARSGLVELLPGVVIDPWVFEPCGYSMNGMRENYYYTVHVTPERDFSYAPFETNDPRFRDPLLVEHVIHLFAPKQAVMMLTMRHGKYTLPAYSVTGFDKTKVDDSTHSEGCYTVMSFRSVA